MDKVYLAHNGQIISHNVVLETEDKFFIDRVGAAGALLPLDKEMLGVNVFETFEKAKKNRMDMINKHIEALEQEEEEINEQTEAVSGEKVEEPEEKE